MVPAAGNETSIQCPSSVQVSPRQLARAPASLNWTVWLIADFTSDIDVRSGGAPEGAFVLEDTASVGVVPELAVGQKCARSWRVTKDVGLDADYPEVSARDAAVLKELNALGRL